MIKNTFWGILICLILVTISCNKNASEPTDSLIANAGPDQTTIVGGYVTLDATSSNPGPGDSYWCEWSADIDNPNESFIFSGEGKDKLVQTLGFLKEGTYKYTLTITNESEQSNTDQVVVTVLPREQVSFKDPALELHARLQIKSPKLKISNTELASLDSLKSWDIVTQDVTTLDGVEQCDNLEYLSMVLQQIEDLSPLSNLINLQHVNFSQNYKIRDVTPLADLTELRYLNLDSNEITNISPLRNLVKLTYLNIMYNFQISDISILSNFVHLEELWLSGSSVKDITSLTQLVNLRLLWLSKCDISTIQPLTNLIKLELLFLKHNHISDISPLSTLTKLERLQLDYNNITDISSLEKLTNLNFLTMSHNNISNIEPLVNNTGLQEGVSIILSDNPLDSLSINEYIPILKNRGVSVLW